MNIKEKIKGIDDALSLDDLPAKYWPESYNEKYLFISYSHLDYKAVFKDLLLFNEEHINVWYDRSLVPSRNWELDAEQFMANYNCIGVVFYISINSLSSDAVYKEILKVKQRKKPFIAIIINNQKMNILEMYHHLNPKKQNKEKEDILKEIFNDQIIYIDINQDMSQKIDKINLLFKQPPVYNYVLSPKRTHSNDPDYQPVSSAYINDVRRKYNIVIDSDGFAALISINNIDIIHADDMDEVVQIDDKYYPLAKIDNCAFANCTKLTSVTFPKTLQMIKSSAFQNCQSLEEVVLPEGLMILKSSAFAGCISLRKVVLPSSLKEIRSWCFAGCHSLKEIIIPKSVEIMEECVFDGLKDIIIKCEDEKLKDGWHKDFNPDHAKIIFGYKR